MRITMIFLLFLAFVASGAGASPIHVAAAADLNFALPELAERYQKDTGTMVIVSFGSSGNFYSQIQNGAPFDLFFSADEEYPRKLADSGKIDRASIQTYAIGHVVLWVPSSSPLDPNLLHMDLLTQASVAKISIANPQHAPYGRAAMAALEHYGLKEKLAGKLVFGENVSQAAQFVQSGNAQAGLIALSLAKSPTMSSAGSFWEIPTDAYPELRQAAGILTGSQQKSAAKAFLNYVLSPRAAEVLRKYGLTPPAHP